MVSYRMIQAIQYHFRYTCDIISISTFYIMSYNSIVYCMILITMFSSINHLCDREQVREEKKPFELRELEIEETLLIREDREDLENFISFKGNLK